MVTLRPEPPAFFIQTKGHTMVAPRFNPPFDQLDTVDWIYDPAGGRGTYVLTQNGALYAYGCPGVRGMNGLPDFAGQTAARLDNPTSAERNAGKKVAIIATSGNRYACPA